MFKAILSMAFFSSVWRWTCNLNAFVVKTEPFGTMKLGPFDAKLASNPNDAPLPPHNASFLHSLSEKEMLSLVESVI